MSADLTYAIRDLVPRPDLVERPEQREINLHHIAQAQLRRKYKSFRSEVALSASVTVKGRQITVVGRLDGYRRTSKGIVLYEIKSVPGDPRLWVNSPLLQNARWQLQLYADLARLAADKPWRDGEPVAGVLCLISDLQRQALESVDIHGFPGFLNSRLQVVLSALHGRRRTADNLSRKLEAFITEDQPADRPEQAEAFQHISRCNAESRLLLSMPPGTGKTRVAVRYALREAMARNLRMVWITVKARGRDELLAELARYRRAGVPLRVLWKTTRERLCDCTSPGPLCPRRLETRSRLFLDPLTEFREHPTWDPDDLLEYARSHALCFHELVSTLEPDADVVVADVNYLLNPSPLFERAAIVVLDEAQNVARRVREYSEVKIRRDDLLLLMEHVSEPVRRTIREILAACDTEDVQSASLQNNMMTLREQTTRIEARLPVISLVQRASRLWSNFPGEYQMAWYRRLPDFTLIGTLIDANGAMANAMERHETVLAMSGSLPSDDASRRVLFPLADRFHAIEVQPCAVPDVFIIPQLIFKYPLTTEDHESATDMLRQIRGHFRPTVAVFGQNRASNELLSMRLRVRGHTVMLDEDLMDDWDAAVAARPDFLFMAMGGRLSEAVNPPYELFSCAAVLSSGYRAPDEFDLLRSSLRRERFEGMDESCEATDIVERRADAVSRVIQAAGRLQRSPYSRKPVFLLNRDFADPDFLRAWPHGWYESSPRELVYLSLNAALEHWSALSHAAS